tara:strand:+ start:8135 stop:8899 length:765 start_codon:yes stop_codon:yes gene_type:complete
MDLIEKASDNKRHPWELARFEVVKDILKNIVNDYEGKKVLDLGCGDLFFIEEFSKNKPNTNFFAVDIAFTDAYVHRPLTTEIHIANSLDQWSEDQNFRLDIVFLMDVLEHIEEDLSFLKNLLAKKYITEKTIFVITVPAYQELFSTHDIFLKHYRRYSKRSLNTVVEEAGLVSMDRGFFFFSLLLPRALEVFKERYLKKNNTKGTGLTRWKYGHFVSITLKRFLIFDYQIHKLFKKIGLGTPGLSNYIICKKPV